MRIHIALVGALTLFVGFVLAITTGRFWLGGIVLAMGGGYCAWRSWVWSGWWRTLVILAIFVVAMIGSHPLGNALESVVGDPVGGWIAAAIAALLAGALCWLLTPASPRRV